MKYIVPKNILISLLADQMELRALEYAGVDNWMGYGENFDEEKADWLNKLFDEEYSEYISWDKLAERRLEVGEFETYEDTI
jgi:hypothetical protein